MRVLVVSVHPDDETLGCGGTLLKHRSAGDELTWLIITNAKPEYGYNSEWSLIREREIENVTNEYGFSKVYNLDLKPAGLNSENQPELIKSISDVFNTVQPEIIYLINRSDAHSDHRFAFDACYSCTKSFRYPYIKTVLMYECLSETEFASQLSDVFIPNYFIDISDFLEKKIDIVKIYESEIKPHPFPRSIENITALAIYRGATAGVKYAEAFQLVKHIDK
jgi:LmbE family N-acetylglucosaminyl deacetylase